MQKHTTLHLQHATTNHCYRFIFVILLTERALVLVAIQDNFYSLLPTTQEADLCLCMNKYNAS